MLLAKTSRYLARQGKNLPSTISISDIKDKHCLHPHAVHTASLILFLDKLFDSLNCNNKLAPSSKPLKGGVSINSEHAAFWISALQILRTMKFYCPKKKRFVTTPSIKNLIFTVKGFQYLTNRLLNNYSFSYVLTRSFNQDPLENFFGAIRSHGHRHVTPGAAQFINSFRTLLVNNFTSVHSMGANCEADNSVVAINNLKVLITKDSNNSGSGLGDTTVEVTNNIELEMPKIAITGRTKIAQCTLTYMSGFIAKKMIKLSKCNLCKNNILHRTNMIDLDFIEARQYPRSTLTKPGNYFNFVVGLSLEYLFYAIPRSCNRKKISNALMNFIENKVNFVPLNCNIHNTFKHKVSKFIVKCAIYFWCKKINRISKGKDLKFLKFLRNDKNNKQKLDPIKAQAYKKYLNKIKRKKCKNQL